MSDLKKYLLDRLGEGIDHLGEPRGAECARKDSVAAWVEVVAILGSYLADDFRLPFHPSHDQLQICVPADCVSKEHVERLAELGWKTDVHGFWRFQNV